MLPHNNNNSNGYSSERESTRSKFKRAFGFIRKQSPSQVGDDPDFQSDCIPRPYSHAPNAVPTSSDIVASTTSTRRPNPKVALQFASNTLQAWGRKHKRSAHSPKPPPDPPGPSPPRTAPHVYDQRPRPSAKTPPPLLLPIQSRVLQRTSQLLPGPDISAALEYMMDAGAHDDKRKSGSNLSAPPQEPPQLPISQPSPQPTPTYPPSTSATPIHSAPVSAHAHPGTISHSPTQPPPGSVSRRASISNDSHPTAPQQLKRRSASLGTLDVPSIVTTLSSDPSPSTPNQLPFSLNVPPSSYHAPPSKTIPAQPAQASTPLETYSPPRLPPYISEPSNKPAVAGSPERAQSFYTEIQAMPGGSLNTRVGLGIRGKLAGWTSGGANETQSSNLSSQREHSRSRSAGGLIGQLAPAATGVAKRAYEKVNNLWSGGHSNTSQTSVGKGEGGSATDREGSSKPRHNRTPNGSTGNWSGNGDERAGRPGSSGRSGNDGGYASDAMGNGMGSGPHLGTMLRAPFRRVAPGHGGVLFGRPLIDCVRDTKPYVLLGIDDADVGIEGRYIPALVLRCVQHLERWGVQEEGLFRITGRASHVAKLRNEFASGADYDLAFCGPEDLDPHAVSSVLKAFLRELPGPILTRDVAPAFEAALDKAKASGAMNPPPMPAAFQGPGVGPRVGAPRLGLPTGPRQNSMALSRFFNNDVHIVPGTQPVEVTAPPPTAPVKPPNSLLREFGDLVQKLPRENRDLLRTIVELLARTAVHAKTTKMPLSNVLLVFCPSVGINPSVFKVMVENHEPIFNQALLPPPSPTPSEHPSEDSVVYEDINAVNTTSKPTPPTDYQLPRTPPQLPHIEPTGLQFDQKTLLPLVIQATRVPSEAASPPQLAYLHSPALSSEPKAEMKSQSPQPSPLVSNAPNQATSHGVPPSVPPSLTPSSSNLSTSELNATVPSPGLRGVPAPRQPSKRIPVPYALQSAPSQSSLHSHSSAVSIPSANSSPSVASPSVHQDPPVASQGLSGAPSAFNTHQLRSKTSFDKPLPNPFSPAALEKAEAPSPVSSPLPSVPSPAPLEEEGQSSGDDADSEAKPGRRQYTRVVSMAPALPELESLPPMTASFAVPSPPPPMPPLPPLVALGPLNLNPKSMFTSTVAPLKVKGRGDEPAKPVPSRTGTSSSSLGSSVSRKPSLATSPSLKRPAPVKDDAADGVEGSETLLLGLQLTPMMMEMEEKSKMRVDEKSESSPPEHSRPSSAEPPKRVESLPVVSSPPIAEPSKLTLDTFTTTHALPEVPTTAALPTIASSALPIDDPALNDVTIPEDESRAPSILEVTSNELTGTWTQDHAQLQGLPPESLNINGDIDDLVERASASPSHRVADTFRQREDAPDAVILAESQGVAPPRLAPPGEGRLSDDWAESVLKAATVSP